MHISCTHVQLCNYVCNSCIGGSIWCMLCDPHVTMFKMHRVLCRVLIYLLLGCSYLPSEPTGSPLQPITLPPSTTQNCSNTSQLIQTIFQNVYSIIIQQVANNLSCVLNGTPIGWGPLCPASSCKAILAALPNNPSGYYWILPNSTNTSVQVYCDLIRYLNGSRGWMRVAYLNMSDSIQSCPSNWATYTAGTYRLCGKPGDNNCYGVNYTTYSVPYYKVSTVTSIARATVSNATDHPAARAPSTERTVETITLAPIIFLYCYFVHLNIFQ